MPGRGLTFLGTHNSSRSQRVGSSICINTVGEGWFRGGSEVKRVPEDGKSATAKIAMGGRLFKCKVDWGRWSQ